MRKLVLLAALAIAASIFVVPSCSTEFGCDVAGAVARADTDECPSSIEDAANDAAWAAARLATIQDAKITTGLFYDEDGVEHRVESGHDTDAERANELLREVGRLPPGASASTADHVEVKIAARMRDEEVGAGVLVINNSAGPCRGNDRPQPMSCRALVPALLGKGTTLTVWWAQAGGPMRSATFTGDSA